MRRVRSRPFSATWPIDEKGDPKLPGYIMYEWVKGDDGKFTYKPQS